MAGKRWVRLDVTWEESEWLDALDGTAAGCWPRLLCLIKRDGIRGRARRPSIAVLAKRWRVSVESILALESAACGGDDPALMVEDGDWVVLKWAEYQEPDATAGERQKRYRQSKHRLSPLRRNTVTNAVTGCDPSMSMSDVVSRRKETTRKSKYLLPEDWKPNEKHIERATELGLDADEEAGRMRDWALAKGEKRIDWDAQFRNWLRQAADRKKVVPLRRDGVTREDVRALLVAAGDWVYTQSAKEFALKDAAEKHPELWLKCRRVMWNLNYGALNAVKGNDYNFNQAIDAEITRIQSARNAG